MGAKRVGAYRALRRSASGSIIATGVLVKNRPGNTPYLRAAAAAVIGAIGAFGIACSMSSSTDDGRTQESNATVPQACNVYIQVIDPFDSGAADSGYDLDAAQPTTTKCPDDEECREGFCVKRDAAPSRDDDDASLPET